jgi:hypothetical protein
MYAVGNKGGGLDAENLAGLSVTDLLALADILDGIAVATTAVAPFCLTQTSPTPLLGPDMKAVGAAAPGARAGIFTAVGGGNPFEGRVLAEEV